MKKNVRIKSKNHSIDLITNGAEDFDRIVLCFHGFGGDKWGGSYAGLKKRLPNTLVASFDSCGHGDSEVSSMDMRLDVILEEIDAVVGYLKAAAPDKPIVFVAVSYGGYRVMQYLIKYKPSVKKVVFVNPAFRILKVLESIRNFDYKTLEHDAKIPISRGGDRFFCKDFVDDLYNNDLYSREYNLNYDVEIVVGKRDSLIPVGDTLEIAEKFGYRITYIDEEHSFEDKENWQLVANVIEGVENEEYFNWRNG